MNINSYFLKKTIIKWYDTNKRDLPWRKKVNKRNDLAYRVLISEIMLQQTTVNTVKNKYIKFIKRWPSLKSLALSPKNQLLTFWSGLGYYKRAINLHKSVRIIEKNFNSIIPNNEKNLLLLPGIGKYTASAVLAIAFKKPVIAIDANVIRIVTRVYALHSPVTKINKIIEEKSQYLIKKNRPGDMIQALMDFGSLICKPRNPLCNTCIINNSCLAFKKNIVHIIPNKKKISFKQKPTKFALAYVIISKKNKILLHKRSPIGMLPSMIGVPTSPWLDRSFNKDEILKFNPLQLSYEKVSSSMIYSFSHFNLKIKVFYSNINEKKIKNHKWYSLKSLNKIELPTVMKNIIYSVIR